MINQTVFRSKLTANFTVLPNKMLRDKRLSFKARGLLSLVLTNTGDWKINKGWVEEQTDKGEGREAITSALKELRGLGYVTLEQFRTAGGFFDNIWSFYDTDGHFNFLKDQPTTGNRRRLAVVGEPSSVSRSRSTGVGKPSCPLEEPSKEEPTKKNQEEEQGGNGAIAPNVVSPKKLKIFSAEALAIYEAYPLKVARPKALDAIVKAFGRGITSSELLAKTKAFALLRKGSLEYCPHPTTWFNQERYNDDPATWARNGAARTTTADHTKGF